jgi:hypothetical protein
MSDREIACGIFEELQYKLLVTCDWIHDYWASSVRIEIGPILESCRRLQARSGDFLTLNFGPIRDNISMFSQNPFAVNGLSDQLLQDRIEKGISATPSKQV